MQETSGMASRSMSSSASELSDEVRDRTPFGRVPPYLRGGLWRHYAASPSKRLVGPRQKFNACLPGN